jgi:hypothetical protein
LVDNIQKRITNQQNITENATEQDTETQATLENATEHTRKQNILFLTTSLNTLLPADNSKPYKPLLEKLQTIDPNNP